VRNETEEEGQMRYYIPPVAAKARNMRKKRACFFDSPIQSASFVFEKGSRQNNSHIIAGDTIFGTAHFSINHGSLIFESRVGKVWEVELARRNKRSIYPSQRREEKEHTSRSLFFRITL
jgi:hypothetical protein